MDERWLISFDGNDDGFIDKGDRDEWCFSDFFAIEMMSIVKSMGNERHKASAQRGSISCNMRKKIMK